MTVLKVLNVGQGDSMILTPQCGCTFEGQTIFIDLGPGQHDITRHITEDDRIRIFITHHDADHLNGLKFFADKMGQVDEITVPFYQNEITLIAKSILSLKGMRDAKDCGEFIRLLEDILENQIYLKSLTHRSGGGPQLSFAYEGMLLCDHIACLNPPLMMNTFNWLKEASVEDLSEVMSEIFEPMFAQSMEIYLRTRARGRGIVDSAEILDITLDEYISEQQDIYEDEIYIRKGSYVVDFIMRNLPLLRLFNSAPERETLRTIYGDFVKCAHDACMVLRAKYCGKTFLLTGDASKKVFRRLMRKSVNISADYLKIPHHGSKRNISRDILEAIHPEVAIISHDNRRFGRATDSHPNMEVLELLEEEGIRIMLTNDVCKNKITCMRKSAHSGDGFVDML